MSKEVETVVVSYQEFTDYEFIPPASYFIMDSLQNYVFYKTSDRAKAQNACDEYYGKGRYTVKASKITKGKIKNEAGIYTVTGTTTRRGQKRY